MPKFGKTNPPVSKKCGGPRDHEESRGAICGLCLQKDLYLVNISPNVLQNIQMFVWEEYHLQNTALPKTVCPKCRGKLFRLSKVGDLFRIICTLYDMIPAPKKIHLIIFRIPQE